MHENQPFIGEKIDIFSLGIILFMMVSGDHPFRGKAIKTNEFYKYLANNETDKFWKGHHDM